MALPKQTVAIAYVSGYLVDSILNLRLASSVSLEAGNQLCVVCSEMWQLTENFHYLVY